VTSLNIATEIVP